MWMGWAGCACALVAITCSYFSLPHAYAWVRSQGFYHSPCLDLRPLPRQAHLSGALAGHHEVHLASRSSLEESCSKVQILVLSLSSNSPLFPNPFTISQVSIWPSISNTDKVLYYTPIFIDIREIHSGWHLCVLLLTIEWMSSCEEAGETEELLCYILVSVTEV